MAINGIPTSFSECVLKTPLSVAVNLRYTDPNGDLVTRLYPNDYIELIGSNVSTLKAQYQAINTTLVTYGNDIDTLQTDVAQLQSSASSFMLYVTGTCLYGNDGLPHPIDDAVNRLMGNTCSYNTVLGTTSALSSAIGAMPAGLSALPAFSQNSAMSGLAGWDSAPTTIAASFSDLWKAYYDARTGISSALAAVTPTCAQVIVDYAATVDSSLNFNLYFSGYTFIPSGYTDNSSIVKITDSSGNIYQTGFNIVTQSNTTSPLSLATSGSALSALSTYYTVQVTSKVQNTTLGTSCEKQVFKTVYRNATSAETGCCPDIGNYTAATSGTTSIQFISGLSYTPRYVGITPKNSFTGGLLGDLNYSYSISYVAGGATISFLAAPSGTLNIDYIAYR